jgi:hypothetical protein
LIFAEEGTIFVSLQKSVAAKVSYEMSHKKYSLSYQGNEYFSMANNM